LNKPICGVSINTLPEMEINKCFVK